MIMIRITHSCFRETVAISRPLWFAIRTFYASKSKVFVLMIPTFCICNLSRPLQFPFFSRTQRRMVKCVADFERMVCMVDGDFFAIFTLISFSLHCIRFASRPTRIHISILCTILHFVNGVAPMRSSTAISF